MCVTPVSLVAPSPTGSSRAAGGSRPLGPLLGPPTPQQRSAPIFCCVTSPQVCVLRPGSHTHTPAPAHTARSTTNIFSEGFLTSAGETTEVCSEPPGSCSGSPPPVGSRSPEQLQPWRLLPPAGLRTASPSPRRMTKNHEVTTPLNSLKSLWNSPDFPFLEE